MPPEPPTLGQACPPEPPTLGQACPQSPLRWARHAPSAPYVGPGMPPEPPTLGQACPQSPLRWARHTLHTSYYSNHIQKKSWISLCLHLVPLLLYVYTYLPNYTLPAGMKMTTASQTCSTILFSHIQCHVLACLAFFQVSKLSVISFCDIVQSLMICLCNNY